MSDSIIQQIKDKLEIVDVIGSYLKLQKTGINYRAICPFHSEKKPSFFVSPVRQSWRCFGCGEGGSVFDFIMKIEGVEFGDALRILARRAGVELQSFRPEWRTARQRLYEIAEFSACFFERQLEASEMGKEVKKYLLKRGLNEASIKKWRLGYAPESWRALSDYLVSQGYERQEIVSAGLAVEPENKGQTPYDRFRKRIIFPVFDLNSQVIGFGARILEGSEEAAKYINTPNTLLYDKSKVLYGLNFAKLEARKKNAVILSEGYLDTILAHQIGFENTVALSGTALTPWHLKILKRYASQLYTAFDMDIAGNRATQKGIDLAQKEDFEVKVIRMAADKDPADIISQNPKEWEEAVSHAKDIFDFYFETAFSQFDRNTPEGKKEIPKILLPKIKIITNKIVQAHWVGKLAAGLKVSEQIIWEELAGIKEKEDEASSNDVSNVSNAGAVLSGEKSVKTRKEMIEERILFLVLSQPVNLALITDELMEIFSPEIKIIFSELKKNVKDKTETAVLVKTLEKIERKSENIKKVLDDVFLMAGVQDFGVEAGEAGEELAAEIELCLEELRKIDLRKKMETLCREIEEAEKENNDKKKLEGLLEEFNKVSKELAKWNY